jgi:hypothetical protein
MPLKKLTLKPGVNKENTRYTNENGWYISDKMRFRQGTPEKIGGWARISVNVFQGICRSLWNWVTLSFLNLIGVGTNLKFYIENGGAYYDITPIRASSVIGNNPFVATTSSQTITVTDADHGAATGDFVTFYGAVGLGGNITAAVLNAEYQVTVINTSSYTINVAVAANATDTAGSPGGGASVIASYQIPIGPEIEVPLNGWGAGGWGLGLWGTGLPDASSLRLWTQSNFGEDLIFAPLAGGIYYWRASSQLTGQIFTITIAAPAVLTFQTPHGLSISDAIQLDTTGALPTPLYPNITYYVASVPTTTTITLRTSAVASSATTTLSGVAITGIAGQFSCTAMSPALSIGQSITISGTLGGTGTITGYVNPTTYYIIATNGSTTFTLSTTSGGSGVVTTAGTPTGLTYTLSTVINTSGTQSGVQTLSLRGIPLTQLSGASDVPTIQNSIFVSDASRFVFAFGCNDYGSTIQDPMLIRWSDQESPTNWTPSATNQAGSAKLSHGSRFVSALQTRQEIVVFTDASVYSLQYQGPPSVWSTQLLGDNISIISLNSPIIASGIIYWMGVDKFYKYDGRIQTLRCDLRQHIFQDINFGQAAQVFSGTNEGFNEVWWFYCSANSTVIDKYVTFNYFENNGEGVWAYGDLGRTAWLDSGLRANPLAATYTKNLVNHEQGVDDNETGTPVAINAIISSAEFDIDDGDHFGFVYRMLPDITFRGSNIDSPQVTMTLIPMQNSGSGYNNPISLGGNSDATVVRTSTAVIEQFTGQVYVRVRGRQMILQIESNQLGCAWQLGSPRIDIKQDGRRGNS